MVIEELMMEVFFSVKFLLLGGMKIYVDLI